MQYEWNVQRDNFNAYKVLMGADWIHSYRYRLDAYIYRYINVLSQPWQSDIERLINDTFEKSFIWWKFRNLMSVCDWFIDSCSAVKNWWKPHSDLVAAEWDRWLISRIVIIYWWWQYLHLIIDKALHWPCSRHSGIRTGE